MATQETQYDMVWNTVQQALGTPGNEAYSDRDISTLVFNNIVSGYPSALSDFEKQRLWQRTLYVVGTARHQPLPNRLPVNNSGPYRVQPFSSQSPGPSAQVVSAPYSLASTSATSTVNPNNVTPNLTDGPSTFAANQLTTQQEIQQQHSPLVDPPSSSHASNLDPSSISHAPNLAVANPVAQPSVVSTHPPLKDMPGRTVKTTTSATTTTAGTENAVKDVTATTVEGVAATAAEGVTAAAVEDVAAISVQDVAADAVKEKVRKARKTRKAPASNTGKEVVRFTTNQGNTSDAGNDPTVDDEPDDHPIPQAVDGMQLQADGPLAEVDNPTTHEAETRKVKSRRNQFYLNRQKLIDYWVRKENLGKLLNDQAQEVMAAMPQKEREGKRLVVYYNQCAKAKWEELSPEEQEKIEAEATKTPLSFPPLDEMSGTLRQAVARLRSDALEGFGIPLMAVAFVPPNDPNIDEGHAICFDTDISASPHRGFLDWYGHKYGTYAKDVLLIAFERFARYAHHRKFLDTNKPYQKALISFQASSKSVKPDREQPDRPDHDDNEDEENDDDDDDGGDSHSNGKPAIKTDVREWDGKFLQLDDEDLKLGVQPLRKVLGELLIQFWRRQGYPSTQIRWKMIETNYEMYIQPGIFDSYMPSKGLKIAKFDKMNKRQLRQLTNYLIYYQDSTRCDDEARFIFHHVNSRDRELAIIAPPAPVPSAPTPLAITFPSEVAPATASTSSTGPATTTASATDPNIASGTDEPTRTTPNITAPTAPMTSEPSSRTETSSTAAPEPLPAANLSPNRLSQSTDPPLPPSTGTTDWGTPQTSPTRNNRPPSLHQVAQLTNALASAAPLPHIDFETLKRNALQHSSVKEGPMVPERGAAMPQEQDMAAEEDAPVEKETVMEDEAAQESIEEKENGEAEDGGGENTTVEIPPPVGSNARPRKKARGKASKTPGPAPPVTTTTTKQGAKRKRSLDNVASEPSNKRPVRAVRLTAKKA